MRGSERGDDKKLWFIKLTGTKPGEKVAMTQTRYISKGNYQLLDETIQDISGTLESVEIDEKEWKGEKYKVVKVTLYDAAERLVFSVGYSSIGRSLMSKLLNVDLGDYIRIGVWNTENGYSSVSVKVNDQPVQHWSGWEEAKATNVKVKVKGKEINDTSEQEQRLENAILEKYKGRKDGSLPQSIEEPSPEPESADLPF